MNAASSSSGTAASAASEDRAAPVSETVLEDPEPWESWETRLCIWSLGIGVAALVVLGVVVNVTILP